MAGTARSSSPGGHPPVDRVRHLQRRLWVAAKRSPGRRFHALYDRIFRGDVLGEAWRRVRANRGAAGVDGETLAQVEAYGVGRMLGELQRDLRAGRYRPAPVRRREIPKPDGGRRPLVSGRLLERGVRRYSLHRWPSARSMKRVRQRVRERTGRDRNGVKDVRVLIRDLNPILRGWGNYFRTGNAATKFLQVDRYVARRLRCFLVKRHGRNLHAGQADLWTPDWLHGQGLYRLRGTIRYPGAA